MQTSIFYKYDFFLCTQLHRQIFNMAVITSMITFRPGNKITEGSNILLFIFQIMMTYYIGVDVGSESVRSALFDSHGHLISESKQTIQIWSPRADYYEQSSDDIWNGVVKTVKVL